MPNPPDDGNREGGWNNRGAMGEKKKDEPLDAYRRIRKPVPPPGKVIPDRRRKIREKRERREADEEREER